MQQSVSISRQNPFPSKSLLDCQENLPEQEESAVWVGGCGSRRVEIAEPGGSSFHKLKRCSVSTVLVRI